MSNYVRNGNGSAHTGSEFSQWQRHTDHCEARGRVTLKTGEECKNGCRSARATREVRFFALLTSLVMTGQALRLRDGRRVQIREFLSLSRSDLVHASFVCPLSGEWTKIEDAHCDRVVPGLLLGEYRPGNIALVSASANLSKSDSAPATDYAANVAAAADKVQRSLGVPRNNDMPDEWHDVVRASSKQERVALGL